MGDLRYGFEEIGDLIDSKKRAAPVESVVRAVWYRAVGREQVLGI